MSERAYHIDVCPECKVREEDGSEKQLFQCRYCERWFCERHLEPRLAVFRDLNKLIKDKEWRTIAEEDWKRKDGHPDYAYTKERFYGLKIEREILRSKIEGFLSKSRAYRKAAPREQYATIGEHHICPKCGSNHTMSTAYREEYEAFECLSCHHTWKESKSEAVYRKPLPTEEISTSQPLDTETGTEKTRKLASNTSRKLRNYFQVSPMKIGLLIFAILLLEYLFLRVYFNTTIYVFVALGTFYLIYRLFIISSRIQVTSDLRLWGLRILSGLTFLVGLLLLVGAFMSYVFSALTPEKLDNPAYMSVFVFFGVFGLGLMLLSSFLMFRFMLKSGVIVYPR